MASTFMDMLAAPSTTLSAGLIAFASTDRHNVLILLTVFCTVLHDVTVMHPCFQASQALTCAAAPSRRDLQLLS